MHRMVGSLERLLVDARGWLYMAMTSIPVLWVNAGERCNLCRLSNSIPSGPPHWPPPPTGPLV